MKQVKYRSLTEISSHCDRALEILHFTLYDEHQESLSQVPKLVQSYLVHGDVPDTLPSRFEGGQVIRTL